MKACRIIVAGSRSLTDYELLNRKLAHLFRRLTPEDTVIISGTAKGADIMGEYWAWAHGFEVMRFPADWEKHGRKAGMIRNEEMAAVPRAQSSAPPGRRGTQATIPCARPRCSSRYVLW
jgi:hypothetical protein